MRRYRRVILPDFPSNLVTVKFILGTPGFPDKTAPQEGTDRATLLRSVRKEMKEHGDMVMLDVRDIGIRGRRSW